MSLTEKLPNVKTCPSMRSTAVWLLPAVTWTLGPGRAWTRVGEPLAGRNRSLCDAFICYVYVYKSLEAGVTWSWRLHVQAAHVGRNQMCRHLHSPSAPLQGKIMITINFLFLFDKVIPTSQTYFITLYWKRMSNMQVKLLSTYERNEPTRVVKSTADLNSPHLTVKSHCTRRVGGDFTGILLSSFTATIYKANVKVNMFDSRTGRECGLAVTSEYRGRPFCKILGGKGAARRRVFKKEEEHAEIERWGKTPLQHKGFWQPVT